MTPPAERAPAPRTGLVWLALLTVYLVWGSTYLGIRISVETLPPFTSAALRFVLAGLILGAFLVARRGRAALRASRREIGSSVLAGVLLLAGGNGMVVLAESRRVPSGASALLVAAVPLFVVVLRTATGDRPRLPTLLGVVVGFAGVAALIFSRGGAGAVPVGGALIVVGAAASWSLGSFLSPRLPMPADPFLASAIEMIAGGLVLAVFGLLAGEPSGIGAHPVSVRSALAVGYLVVAGSLVAFTSYVWLLRHAPISLVATYAYVNPVVAVALGALVVAERVTGAVLLSGLVILSGVVLVVSTEPPGGSPRRPGGSPRRPGGSPRRPGGSPRRPGGSPRPAGRGFRRSPVSRPEIRTLPEPEESAPRSAPPPAT